MREITSANRIIKMEFALVRSVSLQCVDDASGGCCAMRCVVKATLCCGDNTLALACAESRALAKALMLRAECTRSMDRLHRKKSARARQLFCTTMMHLAADRSNNIKVKVKLVHETESNHCHCYHCSIVSSQQPCKY